MGKKKNKAGEFPSGKAPAFAVDLFESLEENVDAHPQCRGIQRFC